MKRKTWYRVKAPKVWRPSKGDELIGDYLKSELKVGRFGEYTCHYVKVLRDGVMSVSGSMADSLFALVERLSKQDGYMKKKFKAVKIIPAKVNVNISIDVEVA